MLSNLLEKPVSFTYALKTLKQKGNLVYEYTPFRNYRLTKAAFEYENFIYSLKELKEKFGITLTLNNGSASVDYTDTDFINATSWKWEKNEKVLNVSESPILRKSGELVDFDTEELSFSVNHPVNVLPLYSYDGSVNLILNDGLNIPRLINSRFSSLGKNQYLIVDRKGDNDTNIYDLGDLFDVDTSLYKRTNYIPTLKYYGTFACGNLPIGNYHFYFKYMDADGNETDFVAESGLVSVFIGNEPYNILSGFRNLNSYKGVSFLLRNIDAGYLYVSVYYTVATSDIYQNATITAKRIDLKFVVNSANMCQIKITGFEPTTEITTDEINLQYLVAGSVETQDSSLNMLFLGNITKPDINYAELEDISLRIVPILHTESYDISKVVTPDYETGSNFSDSYYNSRFTYEKTGYWPGEIYRFGIVYILKDNTLSPVFNIRGVKNLDTSQEYLKYTFKQGDDRTYISYDEESYLLVKDSNLKDDAYTTLENVKGVVSIKDNDTTSRNIYGILFRFDELSDESGSCINALLDLGIKGYFFVRQKRIPTTLCEAYTIGVDKESHTPVIPYDGKYYAEGFLDRGETGGTAKYLVHDYDSRLIELLLNNTDTAAICPDYDLNSPYLNTLFNGDKFSISLLSKNNLLRLSYDNRYYYILDFNRIDSVYEKKGIIGVEDNVKLVAIDDTFYSARAGEAEEAFRFEYAGQENVATDATNLLRGSFGPYIGIDGTSYRESYISIRIPDYNESNMLEYFEIRFNDKSPYYAIGDRYNIDNIKESDGVWADNVTYYRGDCYICLFTHRVNRNFQDPSAPINDKIVDKKCWYDHFEVSDGVIKKENFDEINLGDVNAVKLGLWITITVRSSMNLNMRVLDDSEVDEAALTGHPRTFYPNCPLSTAGVYKVPESLCYNKGFEKGLSERYNFEEPDVPAIKNDFTNRIAYSDIHVNDAFKNGFRVFKGTHYRDYPKTYGQITKLVELRGNLLVVFEHGIGLIAVNERAIAGEGSGGNIYINTSNVLPENPKIISDTFGSQWRESVIKTDLGIYGVDTVGKKIWRTNGETFECISDFKVQHFLNQNISLTERELTPIIGVRNVKTHYNKFKHDVMFTFYDNLHGFEEKVWNLCWNELQLKWITFFSWVPSYSENIYNQYFSFDRNTSKWITKLGVSHTGNDFSDGVCLSNNELENNWGKETIVGLLSLENRTIPSGDGISSYVTYSLERDSFGYYKNFSIVYLSSNDVNTTDYKETYSESYPYAALMLKVDAVDLCSELYQRGTKVVKESSTTGYEYTAKVTDLSDTDLKSDWVTNCVLNDNYCVTKDNGIRQMLNQSYRDEDIVQLLNIKASIHVITESPSSLKEAYVTGNANISVSDGGYYESVVAVIPKYNMQFLTTDFWKHGLSGIIDIKDPIRPAYWYGRQHPFEFEFIVSKDPQMHKIFDNLQIISNSAEPESFHYEVIGDCYNFAKDKENMYVRLEAMKELLQYNGVNITYDTDYGDHTEKHRLAAGNSGSYDRSTIFPLYYNRQKTINKVEDSYKDFDGSKQGKNYAALSGAEVTYYPTEDEFRIWNHSKAVDITKEGGRLRGNMLYKEDKWDVQISPINYVDKNESDWSDSLTLPASSNRVPVELTTSGFIKSLVNDQGGVDAEIPDSFITDERGIVNWGDYENKRYEVKPKDKWIKIRIRYSGEKLAIINAVKTLYSISYA